MLYYNSPMVAEGTILNGRYKLLERIGSGGMSVVYKAQDLVLGRLVAVKLLHESFTGDPDFLARFRQEAFAAAGLQHPNIVTVHDIGQDGNRHYIVMEYVDGQTLKNIVRGYNAAGETMPIGRALDLSVQISDGIGYAHRAGLVHCDVKPQNVLVTRDDRIKVADFGIARAISEASQHIDDQRVWGTPSYFSPEQAAGQAPTPASDVYSLGVMMFEMLSGKLPFTADSQAALALKHMQETPPHVSDYNPNVPEQLDLIVNKLLAKEPTGRYRTAGQLERILASYRSSAWADTGPVAVPLVESQTAPTVAMSRSEQPTQIFPQKGYLETAYTEGYPTVPFQEGTDWLAVGLGLLALIALLGLIPLWYFVYIAYAG
jgi:eukaryotic-like serine/threonine-protein kinase